MLRVSLLLFLKFDHDGSINVWDDSRESMLTVSRPVIIKNNRAKDSALSLSMGFNKL